MNRRQFLGRSALLAAGALTGWAESPTERIVAALASARRFLAERQSPDGAWRSKKYGAFRGGDALTPLVLWALRGEAVTTGLRWLEALTATQATRAEPWADLRYPLFTASYAAQVFAVAGDARRAGFWVELVERLRISEAFGWSADDSACGAWSDAPIPPRLPAGALEIPDMLAPNLSATLLGLQALCAVGRTEDANSARRFVDSCQNFATSSGDALDKGGFFFAPGDSVRNKAGAVTCVDAERYRSYGSATCDGLLALALCGAEAGDPRWSAARGWLQAHAAGAVHSGAWAADRADERESLVFYHAQAFSAALAAISSGGSNKEWAQSQRSALQGDLLGSQRADGSWRGRCPDSFEDDPIVATAFAIRALLSPTDAQARA
jgi:hypothetical protein